MASDFEKAWYHNCPVHRKERFMFFQKCWKCEILKTAKSFRDIRMMLTMRNSILHK